MPSLEEADFPRERPGFLSDHVLAMPQVPELALFVHALVNYRLLVVPSVEKAVNAHGQYAEVPDDLRELP